MELPPEVDVAIGNAGETLGHRDIELLRAIDEYGSINRASQELGRSYSRAQKRIVTLEESFGELVERNRGGSRGGGSTLTDRARTLTIRYERLRATVSGVAETEETVLSGKVIDREGKLATVDTEVGMVKALVPETSEEVSLAIQADAVTLQEPDETPSPDATSARNHLEGRVNSVESGKGVSNVTIDVDADVELSAIVTVASVERLDLEEGSPVTISFKATATRGVPKS